MGHIRRNKKALLNRVRRIRGQVDAVERAVNADTEDCAEVIRLIAACRGAMNALLAEVMEGHIRHHVVEANRKLSIAQREAIEEIVGIIQKYLK